VSNIPSQPVRGLAAIVGDERPGATGRRHLVETPPRFRRLYEQVHNGWVFLPSRAMASAGADQIQFLSDDEWDLRPGEEAGLPFGLEDVIPIFANGVGDSLYIDTAARQPEKAGRTRSPDSGQNVWKRGSRCLWKGRSKRCVARRGVRGSAPSAISRPQGCSGAAIEQYRAGILFNELPRTGLSSSRTPAGWAQSASFQSGWTAAIDPVRCPAWIKVCNPASLAVQQDANWNR
jgi:hypothetical protein